MAVKRNCENKSFLTANGIALIFKGVVGKPRYEELKKCVQWYIHKEEKGNDLILYFLDDNTHADLMDFLHNHAMVHVPVGNSSILTMSVRADDYFTWRIDDKHVAFKNIARLVDVLPEVLENGRTFEEYYNSTLESTTRDENGTAYTSKKEWTPDGSIHFADGYRVGVEY